MLDQNTDRMWYVIGAIVIGAAIIAMGLNIFDNGMNSVSGHMGTLLSKADVAVNGDGNYIQDDGRIIFGELNDITTTVQDFEGRNLILDSKDMTSGVWWRQGGASQNENYEIEDGVLTLKYPEINRGSNGLAQNLRNMELGVEYTMSAESRKIKGSGRPSFWRRDFALGDRYYPGSWQGDYIDATNDWGLHTWSFVPESTSFHIQLDLYNARDTTVQFKKLQFTKGNIQHSWSPAPEDLKLAKSYELDEPLVQGESYTLSADITDGEWVGVWLGSDHFAGYFKNNTLTFDGIDGVDNIIVKSISSDTVMENVWLD